MLFEQRFWEPIARGEVTVTFRRWKRRRRWPGGATGPAGGIIEVDAVDIVDAVATSPRPTPRPGLYPSAAALVADLRGTPDLDLYRIRFHVVDEPDPRAVLAATGELDRRRRRPSSTGASIASTGPAATAPGPARRWG